MRKKILIFMSVTMSLALLMSACGRKVVDNTVKENTVTTTAPEVKQELPKDTAKVEAPTDTTKVETPKVEVKKVTPKTVEKAVTSTNTTKPAVQPNQTTQQPMAPSVQTTTTPPDNPTVPTNTVYYFAGINEQNVIKDSTDFKVTLSNLNPKVGENISFKVETNDPKNLYIFRAEVYGNNMMHGGSNGQWSADKKTYTDTIVVQSWQLQEGSKIDSYIFITDNDTKQQYEYKFTLNVQ